MSFGGRPAIARGFADVLAAEDERPVDSFAAAAPEAAMELDPLPPRRPLQTGAAVLLMLLALAWLTLVGLSVAGIGRFGDIVITGAMVSAPLALLALIWLLVARLGDGGAVDRARREAAVLEHTVRGLVAQLAGERAALAGQVELFLETGADATRQISATALALGEETALIGLRAEQLDAAAAAARTDLGVMLGDLPRAEKHVGLVAERLRDVGRLAEDNVVHLDHQLGRLLAGAREADANAGGAAQRLAGELARIEAASADAGRGVELVAATMARTANDALDRAARAIEAMRQAIEAEGEAIGGTIERARATLAQAGDERLQAVDAGLAAIGARLDGLSVRLAAEAEAGQTLIGTLDQSLVGIGRRFEDLGDYGAERTADIAEAIATLGEHAAGLTERLGDTADRATEALDRRAAALGEVRAKVERDVTEAEQVLAAHGGQRLAAQVGPMIDALNSTAISVTRLLGEEVSEAAWSAYLRGDRGGFARGAVRLLTAGESREVLARYGAEPAFREAVNQYVHDVEAMLRRVLRANGDDPLGVALISSDVGKLYVALAQAIERLRS